MDMNGGFRGRTTGRSSQVDLESQERENDQAIGSLGEKVGLLKDMTRGIKKEVDQQNLELDNMQGGMGQVRGLLGSSMDKFNKVFKDLGMKKMLIIISGVTVVALFFFYVFRK
eukprot:TRINITY_DN9079_c0_g1_i1.p3 TRINITY_DN9079_c0_g1~~TRINITY_DN9079_c0_g1_i1.p3  ORF type:complete len:113 (-),score=25.30 TRINITY_DN9079_c0_g1_i1:850-1188(-)